MGRTRNFFLSKTEYRYLHNKNKTKINPSTSLLSLVIRIFSSSLRSFIGLCNFVFLLPKTFSNCSYTVCTLSESDTLNPRFLIDFRKFFESILLTSSFISIPIGLSLQISSMIERAFSKIAV